MGAVGRGTAGALPAAPGRDGHFSRAAAAKPKSRLGQICRSPQPCETTKPDETGSKSCSRSRRRACNLQWRPKVAEAQVDRGLTVESNGLLDVEEDGLRMALNLKLEFRRSQPRQFHAQPAVRFPRCGKGVAGGNGPAVGKSAGQAMSKRLRSASLKTAKDGEQISLFLSSQRPASRRRGAFDTFSVPNVSGSRRGASQRTDHDPPQRVLLDVKRTVERSGVTRIRSRRATPDAQAADQPPRKACSRYARTEAYRFPTIPFVLRLTAAPDSGQK